MDTNITGCNKCSNMTEYRKYSNITRYNGCIYAQKDEVLVHNRIGLEKDDGIFEVDFLVSDYSSWVIFSDKITPFIGRVFWFGFQKTQVTFHQQFYIGVS